METYLASRPRTAPLHAKPSPESAGRSGPSVRTTRRRSAACYGFGDLSLRQSGPGYSGHTLAIRRGAARSPDPLGAASVATATSPLSPGGVTRGGAPPAAAGATVDGGASLARDSLALTSLELESLADGPEASSIAHWSYARPAPRRARRSVPRRRR